MNLIQRQIKNLWTKRTFDKSLQDYWYRADQKLKSRVKYAIVDHGIKDAAYLNNYMMECYRISISVEICASLINHYGVK